MLNSRRRLVAWRRGIRPEPPIPVSDWADRNRILPPTSAEPGRWRTDRTPYLRAVMGGHMRYYAVPFNIRAIQDFRIGLVRLWRQTLSQRSQTARVSWERIKELNERWIPTARICHPYPGERLSVTTQGRSRMR